MARADRLWALALGLALLAGCDAPPRAQLPGATPAGASTVLDVVSAEPAETPAPVAPSAAVGVSPAPVTPAPATPTPLATATTPVAATPTPTPSPSPSSRAIAGIIVPLYLHDGDPGWGALVTVKRSHPDVPVIAIVNPADGVDRERVPLIAEAIDRLHAVGVKTLGYVPTTYGARQQNSVLLELDRWRSQYPLLDGIFFDEMEASGDAYTYYATLSHEAKRRGFTTTVGNAGIAPDPKLFEAMDVVIVYEELGLPPDAPTANRDHIAMLAHGVGELNPAGIRKAAGHYGWLYVTDDVMPNPWDALSRFTEALAELLEVS